MLAYAGATKETAQSVIPAKAGIQVFAQKRFWGSF
jgi:hypothetical protein